MLYNRDSRFFLKIYDEEKYYKNNYKIEKYLVQY